MKKLSRLKLNSATLLNDKEMRNIVGGYGGNQYGGNQCPSGHYQWSCLTRDDQCITFLPVTGCQDKPENYYTTRCCFSSHITNCLDTDPTDGTTVCSAIM